MASRFIKKTTAGPPSTSTLSLHRTAGRPSTLPPPPEGTLLGFLHQLPSSAHLLQSQSGLRYYLRYQPLSFPNPNTFLEFFTSLVILQIRVKCPPSEFHSCASSCSSFVKCTTTKWQVLPVFDSWKRLTSSTKLFKLRSGIKCIRNSLSSKCINQAIYNWIDHSITFVILCYLSPSFAIIWLTKWV